MQYTLDAKLYYAITIDRESLYNDVGGCLCPCLGKLYSLGSRFKSILAVIYVLEIPSIYSDKRIVTVELILLDVKDVWEGMMITISKNPKDNRYIN